MSLEHPAGRQGGGTFAACTIPTGDPTPACYTVAEFCATHRIGRSKLYQLWAAGTGPRRLRVGTKILISVESARDWRRHGTHLAKIKSRAGAHAASRCGP
jgi:hypothetical protein